MTHTAISSLIQLRGRLKGEDNSSQVEDLICKTNVLLLSLVKQDISIDFMHTTGPSNMLLTQLIDLLLTCNSITDERVRAETSADVQGVLSACMNEAFMTTGATRLPCHGMSAHDKQESIRASINASL
jgi:hypothetical protein